MSLAVAGGTTGIDRPEPPQWTARQTSGYQGALLEFESAVPEYESLLVKDKGKSKGKAPGARDHRQYVRRDKELRRAAKAEGRAYRELVRAVGATPTFRPPGGDAAAPASEEVA